MYEQTGALIKSKFNEHLIPTILTAMALSLATVVDSIIVGQLLGADALAAIGLSNPIISFINLIYVLFGVGGMMCASVSRGKWEIDKANKLFTMGIVGGTAVMLVFLAGVLVFLKQICMALSGNDVQMARLTADYLKALVFTGPVLILSNGVALYMRADGKPKMSAVIVIVANAVNLVFDYILIKFCNTGIMGAGLSTTLGYVFGVVVVLPYLLNRKGIRNFKFVKIKDIGKTSSEVIKTGMPKGFTYISNFLRAIILNSIIIQTLGTRGMTVLTVLLNVLMLASIFVSGTSDTLLPIVGMLHGERDIFGIRKTVEGARNVLIVAVTVIAVFFIVGSGVIGSLFGLKTAEEFDMLRSALIMFSLYIPFYAICTILQNFYNITSREKIATIIALCDGLLFVCSFAFILSKINANLIWLCYGFGSICTLILIIFIGISIRRKATDIKGLLLLREPENGEKVWNMTISTAIEDAAGLAQEVISVCKAHRLSDSLSNRIGIGIEEMSVATINYAHKNKNGKIDIMIKAIDNEIVVRFRDNGDLFNPTEYKADENDGIITDGIELMKKAANDISYSSQLGFNITVLTFNIKEGQI